MRRVFITANVERIANDYAENLFKSVRSDFQTPSDNLQVLIAELKRQQSSENKAYVNYMEKLMECLESKLILCAKPSQMESLIKVFDDIFEGEGFDANDMMKRKIQSLSGNMEFYKYVVEALRYDYVRGGILPYLKQMNIRTCVYCNAQYAVTREELDQNGNLREYKGLYELDHFYPKSRYPFLAINFYNLQPCCSSCNKIKNDKDIHFNLYEETDYREINPFRFELNKRSILKYLLSLDSQKLAIELKDSEEAVAKISASHNEIFKIKELYKCHTDMAEELVWKGRAYDATHIRFLEKMLQSVPYYVLRRILYEFYMEPSQIHLRPLTKMQQDIARQLKLIK